MFKIILMKKFFFVFIFLFSSCSINKNYTYLNNLNKHKNFPIIDNWVKPSLIQVNDVLRIEIKTDLKEASLIYNDLSDSRFSTIELLSLDGYLVNSDFEIELPVLGVINVKGITIDELKAKIKNKLINSGQLSKPLVSIRMLNSKFTVLGEVLKPGTYSFLENRINIFQALGYAGDVSITGKKNKIKLIRETDSNRKIFILDLTSPLVMNNSAFYVRNNDVIIVEPNYSRIKSAGFIGNASSITSIASMIVSLTLLILNR